MSILRYYDPYLKEFTELDTSGWSGGEQLAFHKNMGYYVNEDGQHVWGILPENRYQTTSDGSAENSFMQMGVRPPSESDNYVYHQGMGDDGGQVRTHRETGETNAGAGNTGTPPAPPPASQGPSMSPEQLQQLLDIFSGSGGGSPEPPAFTGQAVGQNVVTTQGQRPAYGDVVQKERLKGLLG